MKVLKIILLLSIMAMLSACGPKMLTRKAAFPEMYNENIVSLLVLSPMNESTAAEATEYYTTTIAEPLSYKGYYVFPVEVVSEILKHEGLPDTELLQNVPPQKFKEYFGADAVMFVTISKWDTSYYVIGGNVKVSITYKMVSTESGKMLWQYQDQLTVDTTGDGSAGLIGQLVLTAVQTAMTDYVPIAKRVNYMALHSMPHGKYHVMSGKDMDDLVVNEDKMKFDK